MSEPAPVYRRFRADAAAVRTAAREAIESWNGEWEADDAVDRFRLPIQAGLRWAVATGSVRVEEEEGGHGTRIALDPDPADWSLHLPAVVILALAAVAGVAVVLWPFFPSLLPLVPLGLLAGLGAWFLVVARLQNRGLEELMDTVAADLGELADDA